MKYTDYDGTTHEAVYVKDIAMQYNDNGYVFNHGLNAMNMKDTEENLNNLLNNNNLEVCCSFNNQHVGTIGVELEGTCLIAADRDLMTRLYNGQRIIFKDMLQYIHSCNLEDIKCEYWYGEAVVTKYRIKRLWCNPYTSQVPSEAKKVLMEAKRLAAKYNLELTIVMN